MVLSHEEDNSLWGHHLPRWIGAKLRSTLEAFEDGGRWRGERKTTEQAVLADPLAPKSLFEALLHAVREGEGDVDREITFHKEHALFSAVCREICERYPEFAKDPKAIACAKNLRDAPFYEFLESFNNSRPGGFGEIRTLLERAVASVESQPETRAAC